MTGTAPVSPAPVKSTVGIEPQRRWLIAATLFLVAARVVLYVFNPDYANDFDQLYYAAQNLVAGENPYPIARKWFHFPLYYPLPTVLFTVPFAAIPLLHARIIFDMCVGGVFAYALWRYRGPHSLLALVSGAFLFAMRNGQVTPLIVAACLIPRLGFLLVVKPNMGLALWLTRPNRQAVVGGAVVLLLSLLVLPTWPLDWIHNVRSQGQHLQPPLMRPFGFLLLLAALRWRTLEGRLILFLSVVPQNSLPHELVPLALIPASALHMGIYVVGTWITVAVAADIFQQQLGYLITVDRLWPALLCAGYLPMLYLVLRSPAHVEALKSRANGSGSI